MHFLPATDLILAWTSLRSLSGDGTSDIDTKSARIQTTLLPRLRADNAGSFPSP
jgi:hypothetical protein